MNLPINFIAAAVIAGTPLLFGTLGEILTEKSGNLNLGVEGLMYMGGVSGLAAAYIYEKNAANTSSAVSVILAILFALLISAAGSLIYGFLTISLRTNQNVTGLALAIFGTGFGNLIGDSLAQNAPERTLAVSAGTKSIFNSGIFGSLGNIPVAGKLLFGYGFMVYLAVAAAVIMMLVFKKSRVGLSLRAVGENTAAADADGIPAMKYKYLATVIGGSVCGLGGLFFIMNPAAGVGGVWVHNCLSGKGWIAVALVIFALWSPLRALAGSFIFGALSIARLYFPLKIPAQLYDILPYVCTIAVLIAVSLRKKRENNPPGDLGNAYFRENR